MQKIISIFYSCLLSLILLTPGCGDKENQQAAKNAYKNPDLPLEQRVQNLLSQMTLREKVAQVMCIWRDKEKFLTDGRFDTGKAASVLKHGIGQIGRPSEQKGAKEMAEFTNEIQRYMIEETRLGIPVIFHEECLHGHAAPEGTHFPQPIALAGTWNRELIQQIYERTSTEARLRGARQALTPVVDVVRDPRWGRVEETFGEDPYLVGEMGLAAVQGFQGDAKNGIDSTHLIATLKHFAAHGTPEGGNNIAPPHISERELREVHLAPFRKCVEQGGVKSIMASYNEINGVPSHRNAWLIQDVLRDEWGFKGVVVSDYFAIEQMVTRHHVATDSIEAARQALTTGIDIELPDPYCYPSLYDQVKSGKIKEAVLDSSVARILRHKFETGLFENPYVDPQKADEFTGNQEGRDLALQSAHQSIVMLKNEGQLAPLDKKSLNSIAVIGPNANRTLLGGYSGTPRQFITVLDGIRNRAGDSLDVMHSEGVKITKDSVYNAEGEKIEATWDNDPVALADSAENIKRIREAVQVAQKADAVVLCIGGNELTSREGWSDTHLGDRPGLQLLGQQKKLVKQILNTGKPVVACLFNGKPLAVNYLKENVPTIFECWYLGQETGNALADVLFGKVNPSGKLSISFPRSAGHIPAYYNHKPSARRGYLFDDVSPLFPFGYGLSYTRFSYDNMRLSKDTIGRNEQVKVMIDVTNTGQRQGDEVVQLYIRDEVSSVTRPVKELKGFERVSLNPGETQTVNISLDPEALAFYNIDQQYTVEPGTFKIMAGASSRDQDLKTTALTVK